MKKDQTTIIMVIIGIIALILLFKDKLGSFFSGDNAIIDGSGGGGGSYSVNPPPSDTVIPPPNVIPNVNTKNADIWLNRPISQRFPWIPSSFYEASGRAYGIENMVHGGIANKVLAMMSTTNKNVKLMPDYTFQVTIPAKTNISSFKAVSVVLGGVANKIKAMTGSKVPALIKKLNNPPPPPIRTPTPTPTIQQNIVKAIVSVKPSIISTLGNKVLTTNKTPLTPAQVFLKFGK